jgi:hypothetical protein
MSKRPSTDAQDGLANKRSKQSNEDTNAYDFSTQESVDESFVGFQENEIKKVS